MKPTAMLTYFVDGMCLKLPLVKRNRSYKNAHWLPVVLKLGKALRRGDTHDD